MGTKATLSSPVLSDESFPGTGIFLEDEASAELQMDPRKLCLVPFNYLCTVHNKLYTSSMFNLLRMVFNL